MNSKITPVVRFPGFTDTWEQRKFEKVFDVHTDFVSNGSFQALKDNVKLYHTENYAYMIRLQDASNNWKGPWLYTDKKGFEFLDKSTVYENDILMSDRGTIGKFFLVPKLGKPMTLSSNAVLLRSSKNDNYFIYYLLNTKEVGNQIKMRTTPGVQPMISKTEFKQITAKFPRLNEQIIIGSFFKQLDNTITLHQRKLELLKDTKKGLLQKIFPKDGANVPEIRFEGFTDAWEQRKVSEFAEETYGGGTPKTSVDEYWDGNLSWIQSSDLSEHKVSDIQAKKKITEQGLKNSAAKLVPANSIAIVTRVGVGKLALMPFEYATSQDFLSLSKLKVDEWFAVYSLYKKLQSGLHAVQGTSIKGITKEELLSKEIMVPVDIDEQSKIGSFFKQIDDTITLHQRELDLLKETKKAFLQKMLV
ncbi:restriction endonuclease subunit S [Rummeliibacillus sp. TYF-LIM-RU47]|uniref:restriction endonuclease subunit S n=1 Tax=Rummeliibacillus sp. TYF-LIM-RU47 TaxID=2608406 RepID=UPI0012396B2F|nr:restriction endonuclease subunit S [Rummeliibacillus sp. TYF-LIM-RU47]